MAGSSPSPRRLVSSLIHALFFRIDPFFLELSYFLLLSVVGILPFKIFKLRNDTPFPVSNLDLWFTSVSSVTVSSMDAVEMQAFSNIQLVCMTVMMFVGGEVYFSFLRLRLYLIKIKMVEEKMTAQIEVADLPESDHSVAGEVVGVGRETMEEEEERFKVKCLRVLSWLVLCYLLVIHVLGFVFVLLYVRLTKSAHDVLKVRGLVSETFSIFTVVSTFSNCGFIPTNENMVVFSQNSGLLLLLIAQVLMGNTLYPVCLRYFIWALEKLSHKPELTYLLNNPKKVGYDHLFSRVRCSYLAITVISFIVLQLVVFFSFNWNYQSGLNPFQKIVGALFQIVNARHTGENIVDLTSLSLALVTIFVVMMYLPPYTSFLPPEVAEAEIEASSEKTVSEKKKRFPNWNNIFFSPLTHLTIFVVLISMTERHHIINDPLNFNLLSIIVEVVSASGNVGFTMGYSCELQIKPESHCIDPFYGFVGRWTNGGKFLLIMVMFYGKIKKFNSRGGSAWILA